MDPLRQEPPAALADLARTQHGVVALRQLRELGWTDARVKSQLRRGRLVRVERRVYAVGHHPLGARTRWMAAVLALGPGAVLSHISAAMLWGLLKVTMGPVHVTASRQARRRRGLVPHESGTLTRADHTTRDHIPTTTIPRTAIDLADVLAPAAYARAIERIPLLDARALRRALDRHPGRVATGPLAQMLALYDETDRTRSHLERAFLALIRRHGLPRPHVNVRIAGRERDFAWPEARLVIEVDGGAFHAGRDQRAADARRDLELNLAGWRIQRFTYEQVTLDPEGTAAAVRALLAR